MSPLPKGARGVEGGRVPVASCYTNGAYAWGGDAWVAVTQNEPFSLLPPWQWRLNITL